MTQLRSLFTPRASLDEAEVNRALRWLTWEGMASMGFGSITGSGFLAAFALLLGANNLQIGILAAIPFMTMPLQLFTVAIIDRMRRRKLLAVTAWAGAQALWIPIGLIPVFLGTPSAPAVSLLLGLVAIRGILVAMQNSAWNSWLRELVPQAVMGAFFARRLSYAHVAAMVFGLGAALFVDFWRTSAAEENVAFGYTIAILFGAIFLGMGSPIFRMLVPEPQMEPAGEGDPSLVRSLAEPLRDDNYKHVVRFMFLWNLAIQLAVPFFAVYMLTVLGLSLTAVMLLSVVSQASNVLFLKLWGPLSDRTGAKPVLSLSASLYLLVILGWTFTSMPDRYFLTIPLLVVLHIMAGAAAAGVNVTSGTVALKLSPRGKTTSYLAAQSVAANIGAGIGPLIGGTLIDFFSVRSLSLDFAWSHPGGTNILPALHLTGYDFMFGIAFLLGLLTLQILTLLKEEGEVSREVVLESLMAPMQRVTAPASSIPGIGIMTQLPYTYLRRVPLPGMDVALGVTAYQIAESVRMATQSAERGRQHAERVAHNVAHSVSEVIHRGENVQEHAAEVALHAARGAMHGLGNVGRLTRRGRRLASKHALQGVLFGMAQTGRVRTLPEVIRSAVYGVVQGAVEAGTDPKEAVAGAVEAAREMAAQANLQPEEAERLAEAAAEQAVRDLANEPDPEMGASKPAREGASH